MRVDNKGLKTAHNVCVSATEIEFRATGTTVFADEVLEFLLALSDGRAIFDLPPGGHRFIDVFFVEDFGNVTPRFGFAQTPHRLSLLGFGKGSYSVRVVATADNASAKHSRISW